MGIVHKSCMGSQSPQWIFLFETINFRRKLHKTNIIGIIYDGNHQPYSLSSHVTFFLQIVIVVYVKQYVPENSPIEICT